MMSRQLPFGGSSHVATSSFKLKVQRAFHSLATLTYSASNKSISLINSYLYQIHFQQNLYREKNAPVFPVFLHVNCCSFPAVALPSFLRNFCRSIHVAAVSLRENGNICSLMTSGLTPFSFTVLAILRNLPRCSFGSSVGWPVN